MRHEEGLYVALCAIVNSFLKVFVFSRNQAARGRPVSPPLVACEVLFLAEEVSFNLQMTR
jgi:hypothetical protein